MQRLDYFEGTEYEKININVVDDEGKEHGAIAYLYGDPKNLEDT